MESCEAPLEIVHVYPTFIQIYPYGKNNRHGASEMFHALVVQL